MEIVHLCSHTHTHTHTHRLFSRTWLCINNSLSLSDLYGTVNKLPALSSWTAREMWMFQPPPLAGMVLHSLDQDVYLIWLCMPPTRRASWFYVRCLRCFWIVFKKWPVGRFVVCDYPRMLSTKSSLCRVVNKPRSIKFFMSSSIQASSLLISLQFSFSVFFANLAIPSELFSIICSLVNWRVCRTLCWHKNTSPSSRQAKYEAHNLI